MGESQKPQESAPAKTSAWGLLDRKLLLQRALVVLALAGAAGLQYYLVNMPVAELSQTSKFAPATARVAEDVLEFTNPDTGKGHFAFAYDQPAQSDNQRMLVDGYFAKASLSEETLQRFAALGVPAPPGPVEISYLAKAVGNGTCSTNIHVQTTGTAGERSVQFSQIQRASSDRHRLLSMRFMGTDAEVSIASGGSFGADKKAACQPTLSVGTWQQAAAFIPIKIKVPADSEFRIHWEAVGSQAPNWSTLLDFGDSQGQTFRATGIRIVPADAAGKTSKNAGLVAKADSKNPFTVTAFAVGTNQLQFGASGTGHVWENGKVVSTANVIDAIGKYPLISALFGAANLGLLNWSKRKFFPPPRAVAKAVVRFPRRRPPDSGDQARTRAAGR